MYTLLNNRLKAVICLWVFNMCVCACTKTANIPQSIITPSSTSGVSITSEYSTILRDSIAHLNSPGMFLPINDVDSMIIIGKKNIYLSANRTIQKTIGETGSGPGQFHTITAACLSKDTLFLLDPANSKLLGYSITTGKCVFELIRPNFNIVTSIFITVHIYLGVFARKFFESLRIQYKRDGRRFLAYSGEFVE